MFYVQADGCPKMYFSNIKEDMFDANEACDNMENCNQCSKVYGCLKDGSLIPCNFIRKKYGISIWDYKKEYRNTINL